MNKSIFYLITFLIFSSKLMSQDLDDINEMMGNLQYKSAKTAIDKYLSNPKKAADADGYYFKGRVYNSLSNDSTVTLKESYSLKTDAFEAFKQCQQLDKKEVRLKLESYQSFFALYFGFYDLGVKYYNAEDYDAAVDAFKKTLEINEFIYSKKYENAQAKLNKIDTSLILNIAAAAIKAKKDDIAVLYYNKLVDYNIGGRDYKDVYLYLIDYYSKKQDEVAFNKILEKSKKMYPNDPTWVDLEIEAINKKGDKSILFAKYEELIAADPSNFVLQYNYSVELYNGMYGKNATKAGDTATAKKLTETLIKAIANEPKEDITATVLICNHLYNQSSDLLNSASVIKSNKPEDIKVKNAIKSKAGLLMDDCIKYAENAERFYQGLSTKTSMQKANFKIILGYLNDLYSVKKNAVKAAEYEKKLSSVEKL